MAKIFKKNLLSRSGIDFFQPESNENKKPHQLHFFKQTCLQRSRNDPIPLICVIANATNLITSFETSTYRYIPYILHLYPVDLTDGTRQPETAHYGWTCCLREGYTLCCGPAACLISSTSCALRTLWHEDFENNNQKKLKKFDKNKKFLLSVSKIGFQDFFSRPFLFGQKTA